MKNIKIFCDKKRLKKLKLSILPIVISVATLLGGCSVKDLNNKNTDIENIPSISVTAPEVEDNMDVYVNNNYQTDTQPNINFGDIQTTDVPISLDLLNQTINLNDISYLQDILEEEVVYQYSEYFEVDKAFNAYNNYQQKNVNSNNIIENGQVNEQKLYQTVLRNNEIYLKQNNNNVYQTYSEEKIKEICQIISESINATISNEEIDLNVLDYNLSNLKIFQFSNYAYARVTTDNCLAVNESMINTLKVDDAFRKTIVHESMHLIQKTVEPENAGVNFKFESLEINPLYNNWFLETSAEKSASKINGEEVTYQNEMLYLDGLIIATGLENKKVESSNFNTDLNQFYSLLSCDGLISSQEIANMMFGIEFVLNETPEFIENYQNKTGKTLSYSEIQDLKQDYKEGYFKTLAKKLYYTLSTKEMTLNDAFAMITLYEKLCDRVLRYSDQSLINENVDFIEYYNQIQSRYFKALADKLQVDEATIIDLYNYYHENQTLSFDFTNRSEDLNDIYAKVNYIKKFSINKIYSSLDNEPVKKY